jgi:hypothetical protein
MPKVLFETPGVLVMNSGSWQTLTYYDTYIMTLDGEYTRWRYTPSNIPPFESAGNLNWELGVNFLLSNRLQGPYLKLRPPRNGTPVNDWTWDQTLSVDLYMYPLDENLQPYTNWLVHWTITGRHYGRYMTFYDNYLLLGGDCSLTRETQIYSGDLYGVGVERYTHVVPPADTDIKMTAYGSLPLLVSLE